MPKESFSEYIEFCFQLFDISWKTNNISFDYLEYQIPFQGMYFGFYSCGLDVITTQLHSSKLSVLEKMIHAAFLSNSEIACQKSYSSNFRLKTQTDIELN